MSKKKQLSSSSVTSDLMRTAFVQVLEFILSWTSLCLCFCSDGGSHCAADVRPNHPGTPPLKNWTPPHPSHNAPGHLLDPGVFVGLGVWVWTTVNVKEAGPLSASTNRTFSFSLIIIRIKTFPPFPIKVSLKASSYRHRNKYESQFHLFEWVCSNEYKCCVRH